MPVIICLGANTLTYPNGGGHLSAYINWALGFLSNQIKVYWLEGVHANISNPELHAFVDSLRAKLNEHLPTVEPVLYDFDDLPMNSERLNGCLHINDICESVDLFLNQNYWISQDILKKFKRTALLDIDPGLLQSWYAQGIIKISRHDHYFTIGETVGQPGSLIPSGGFDWIYTPPCVSLDWWPISSKGNNDALTTVTHWQMRIWEPGADGVLYSNDKRSGFLPYLELPSVSSIPLELALLLGDDKEEFDNLQKLGWRVKNSHEVVPTPEKYQQYIQNSVGEFSCVKQSCVRFQNAWISDRTICYLASGKPAVIEHTGASRFLPDDAGLLRFKKMDEARKCIDKVANDYENQSRYARKLAEEYFDARKIAAGILERTLN